MAKRNVKEIFDLCSENEGQSFFYPTDKISASSQHGDRLSHSPAINENERKIEKTEGN